MSSAVSSNIITNQMAVSDFTSKWLLHIHPATVTLCGCCRRGGRGSTVVSVLTTVEAPVYHQHLARTTPQSVVTTRTHDFPPGLWQKNTKHNGNLPVNRYDAVFAVLFGICVRVHVPNWQMKQSFLSQSLVASHWKPESFKMCPQAAPGSGLLAQFE